MCIIEVDVDLNFIVINEKLLVIGNCWSYMSVKLIASWRNLHCKQKIILLLCCCFQFLVHAYFIQMWAFSFRRCRSGIIHTKATAKSNPGIVEKYPTLPTFYGLHCLHDFWDRQRAVPSPGQPRRPVLPVQHLGDTIIQKTWFWIGKPGKLLVCWCPPLEKRTSNSHTHRLHSLLVLLCRGHDTTLWYGSIFCWLLESHLSEWDSYVDWPNCLTIGCIPFHCNHLTIMTINQLAGTPWNLCLFTFLKILGNLTYAHEGSRSISSKSKNVRSNLFSPGQTHILAWLDEPWFSLLGNPCAMHPCPKNILNHLPSGNPMWQ